MDEGEQQMMHQPELRARIAYVVCFLFLTTLASPLIAARSAVRTTPAPIRVAICPSIDASYGADADLLADLASAAQLALADSDVYQVVPLEAVPGPDRLLRVAVQEISRPSGARPLQVRLAAELWNATSGEPICTAAVISIGSAAPTRAASADAVARAAVNSAVQAAVAQVTKAAEIRGIVIGVTRANRVRVNLGRARGIKPGTELAIYHNDQYLATAEARGIRQQESDCIITDIKEGAALSPGDEVRVVSIPAKAPPKRRAKGKKSALITGIVVLAGLGLLVASNSGKGDRVPTTTVSLTATSIVPDGIDSVSITATVNTPRGGPVADSTPIIFRIIQGRGQLQSTDTSGPQVTEKTVSGAATVTLTTDDRTSPPIIVRAIPPKGNVGSTPPIQVVGLTDIDIGIR